MIQNLHLYVLAAPLLAAFACNLLRVSDGGRRWLPVFALGSLGISLAGSVLTLMRVMMQGPFRYTVGGWQAPFGIELVVDHLSAMMMVLVAFVSFMATFSVGKSIAQELPDREYLFFTLYLIFIAGLFGLILTGDAFNLYVLLEITSIATYGLIAMGKGRAPLASFNYIIMGTIGACFYLLGVGYLYILTGTLNMADLARIVPQLPGSAAVATAAAFILVGLWVKMALFPLHVWLPRAYTHAPSGTSLLVAPLMTKVSIYLMIRVLFSIFFPGNSFFELEWINEVIVWVAVVAILAASALALSQTNLKKMLTYLIIAEVGYMVGGVWLANLQGLTGAVFHIVNDALMTLCLFLAITAIAYRHGSLEFDDLKGMYRKMPWTMAAFTLAAASMVGVPPTCGFFSKWYLLLGGIEAQSWEFVAALVLSSLINALLFVRVIEITYFRAGDASLKETVCEAPAAMLSPLMVVAVTLLAVGFFAGPLVDNVIRLALPGTF